MGFVSAGYILWTSTPEATPKPVLCHGRKLHRYSDMVWCWPISCCSRRDCERDTKPRNPRSSDQRLCDHQNICHTRPMLHKVLSFLKDQKIKTKKDRKPKKHQKIKTKPKKKIGNQKTSKDQNKTSKDQKDLKLRNAKQLPKHDHRLSAACHSAAATQSVPMGTTLRPFCGTHCDTHLMADSCSY